MSFASRGSGSLSILLTVLPVLGGSQTAAAQGVVFEDSTFDVDSDWSDYGPYLNPSDVGDGDLQAAQATEGSNDYLSFAVQGASPEGAPYVVWGILIREGPSYVYDPTEDGTIDRVWFEADARVPPGERGQRIVTMAVEQDGFVWTANDKRAFISEMTFTPVQIMDLRPEDFTFLYFGQPGQPERPNFSEPIRFGIVNGNSCPSTSVCTNPPPSEVHVDNWVVTVLREGEEPGTGGTSGSGGTAGSGGAGGSGADDGAGGAAGGETPAEQGDCGCHVIQGDPAKTATELALLAALILLGLRLVRRRPG